MFVGAAFGSGYAAISPFRTPVKTILIFSVLSLLFMDLSLLTKWLPGWETIIYGISRMAFGFFYSMTIMSQSVVYYYFQEESDRHLMPIWYALGSMGDPIGIFIAELFLVDLGLDW